MGFNYVCTHEWYTLGSIGRFNPCSTIESTIVSLALACSSSANTSHLVLLSSPILNICRLMGLKLYEVKLIAELQFYTSKVSCREYHEDEIGCGDELNLNLYGTKSRWKHQNFQHVDIVGNSLTRWPRGPPKFLIQILCISYVSFRFFRLLIVLWIDFLNWTTKLKLNWIDAFCETCSTFLSFRWWYTFLCWILFDNKYLLFSAYIYPSNS